MSEPNTVAGLAIGACSALSAVIVHLWRSFNRERAEMQKQIAELQAARVTDAQAIPKTLIDLATNANRVMEDSSRTNEEVADALNAVSDQIRALKKRS